MSRLSMLALAATLAAGSLTTVSDAWARGPGGPGRGPGSFHTFSAPRFSTAPRFNTAPRFVSPRFTSPRFAPRYTSPRFASPRFGARPYFGSRNYLYRGYPRRYVNRRFIGPYPYLGYAGCYRWRTIWTAYGPQTVRVNVCGYPVAYRYRYPFVY